MSRTRQFNEQDFLVTAIKLFATMGYEGASMESLVTSTGLLRGSIYQAYGSKAGVFDACLKKISEAVRVAPDAEIGTYADFLIVAMWERSAKGLIILSAISMLEQRMGIKMRDIINSRFEVKTNIDLQGDSNGYRIGRK